MYHDNNAQTAFTVFQGVIDHHFRLIVNVVTSNTNYKNRHPWMTQALRKYVKTKNSLYRDSILASNSHNSDISFQYEKYRNKLISLL